MRNHDFHTIEGALASCWVRAENPQSAIREAKFFVRKYDWRIQGIETLPIEVERENFIGKDVGMQLFEKCQLEGISMAFSAWSRDGKSSSGPVTLKPFSTLDREEFINRRKELSLDGRCLHYDSGDRCNEIISAHSIQKNKALSEIAKDGHVYVLNYELGNLIKTQGKITYEKRGINKVSTFLGFCGKHNIELFKPIDNYALIPTDQQVLLYAYRSMCREIFVKENAYRFWETSLSGTEDQPAITDLISTVREGTALGLKNLLRHKEVYDTSLLRHNYEKIRYVIFLSKKKPFAAFSGLISPDYDFLGQLLQDLTDKNLLTELITFCSAPMQNGDWGFLFAWHDSNTKVCVDYMRSLAAMMHDGHKLDDMLFRLIIKNCENHAFSPFWWESLSQEKKDEITTAVTNMANLFDEVSPTYLMEGLEGIAEWDLNNVISKME